MADLISDVGSSRVDTRDIGQTIDSLVRSAKSTRRTFERRWYDNNFFDDGFHFRYLERATGKIVDLSERATLYSPTRAIPKASHQIRGIVNLLMSNDPTPVVYPARVNVAAYPPVQGQDPQTGQPVMQQNPEYLKAKEAAKDTALKTGHWIDFQFKEEEINEKLAQMLILTAKHGVSFLQIWPDPMSQAIKTQIYDAFDIYLIGQLTDPQDSPFIAKGIPKLITEIKANPQFEEEQLAKITPDNKLASSEIKEAYMNARYGKQGGTEAAPTITQYETFIKEHINSDNVNRILNQKDGAQIMKGKKMGAPIIRQVFTAGGVWLRDRYLNMTKYPFIDFRMEPGPIYQVPLIERFIPSNKSIDLLVSRLERYTHSMVTGTWLKKQGEQFKPTNVAGGQVIEYSTTPPEQMAIAPIPNFYFNFINLLNGFLEEQGTTLGRLPAGIRSANAIEAIQSAEFVKLSIAQRRLKRTVRQIAQSFLDIANDHFVEPQTAYYVQKGEPKYFDFIGAGAAEKRQELGVPVSSDTVQISSNCYIDIEIEPGMAYTEQGKKDAAQKLADFMIQGATAGYVNPDAVKVFIENLLSTYHFGAVGEFMDAMSETNPQMTEQQIQAMKVALASVIKDLKDKGDIFPDSKTRIQESMVGAAQVMKDTGHGLNQEAQKPPTESINYKDAPEDIKRQMEAQLGFKPSNGISPAGTEQITKVHTAVNAQKGGTNGSSNGSAKKS